MPDLDEAPIVDAPIAVRVPTTVDLDLGDLDAVSLIAAALPAGAVCAWQRDDGAWVATVPLELETEARTAAVPEALALTRLAVLAALKLRLCSAVDSAAEEVRARYITAGSGQAMTYQAKAEEARAFAADANPVAADYPMLSAEIGITGDTLGDVAGAVLAAFAAWQAAGAAIEAVRLAAKRDLTAAATADAARAIHAAVTWPAPATGGA